MVANVVVDDDDDARSIWLDANAVENAFGTSTKKISRENERPGSGVASVLMKQSVNTAAATFSSPISDAGSSSAESREEDGSRDQLLPKKKKKKQAAASSPSGIMQRKSYNSRFGKNRLPSSAGSSVVSMHPLMGLPEDEDEDEGGKMIDYSYAVDEDDVEEEEVQLMENASKEEPSIANETNKKKSSSKMTSTFKRAFGKKKSRQTRLCLSLIRASRTMLRQRLILIKWRERKRPMPLWKVPMTLLMKMMLSVKSRKKIRLIALK